VRHGVGVASEKRRYITLPYTVTLPIHDTSRLLLVVVCHMRRDFIHTFVGGSLGIFYLLFKPRDCLFFIAPY